MNRADKRKRDRKVNKLKAKANKFTEAQLEMMELYAKQKTEQILDIFKKIVTESMFDSMRENRISIERASKIIDRANEIMGKKVV